MSVAACAVALVLLIDVSDSVSAKDFAMQRDGTAAALRSEPVRRALRSAGDVAVTVIEWATFQKSVLPWTMLRDDADVDRTAAAIGRGERVTNGNTYMGGAIAAGISALRNAPCEAERKVFDISGDGSSNMQDDIGMGVDSRGGGYSLRQGSMQMMPMMQAHRLAEDAGIEINGLPIVTSIEPDVASWYRENVTANGGFVIQAHGFEDFQAAMTRKMALEISMITSPAGTFEIR